MQASKNELDKFLYGKCKESFIEKFIRFFFLSSSSFWLERKFIALQHKRKIQGKFQRHSSFVAGEKQQEVEERGNERKIKCHTAAAAAGEVIVCVRIKISSIFHIVVRR